MISKYNVNGPRYTSYPTANQFESSWSGADLVQLLSDRQLTDQDAVSVYAHIPFCASLCYYCGCNKLITQRRNKAQEYLVVLQQELAKISRQLGSMPHMQQLHLGGGTPTYLSDEQIAALLDALGCCFNMARGSGQGQEYSLEIDPRTVDPDRIARLAALGFNRLSIGIQDYDPVVQRAIHRVQDADQISALFQAARDSGFESISADLIYGLPEQSSDTFAATVERLIEQQPDRISLYSYAHLPDRFPAQRILERFSLPDPSLKLHLLCQSISQLQQAGYIYIGMDHFALPDDPLCKAWAEGTLQRNFQGYSTHRGLDLIGLGVSAISQIGDCYSQNHVQLAEYQRRIREGKLATEKGLSMTRNDLIRREVIHQLMCHSQVEMSVISETWSIDFQDFFASSLALLNALATDGLVELDSDRIRLTDSGRLLVRQVAMCFDPAMTNMLKHFQNDWQNRPESGEMGHAFSRTI